MNRDYFAGTTEPTVVLLNIEQFLRSTPPEDAPTMAQVIAAWCTAVEA